MMKHLAVIFGLLVVGLGSATAAGLDRLDAFVKTVKSGRAEFMQVVTSPPKEGQVAKVKTSSGTFAFSRPSRFQFIYGKPFAQSIVADGQSLWLFDADLNQVTVRKQAQALSATPAALIAAAPDLRALEAEFTLSNAPDAQGLQWVLAIPKSQDGQLQSVRVGFRVAGALPELAALEINDSFGQRSLLTFSKVEVNPTLSSDVFQFKPPAGADVIAQ